MLEDLLILLVRSYYNPEPKVLKGKRHVLFEWLITLFCRNNSDESSVSHPDSKVQWIANCQVSRRRFSHSTVRNKSWYS